ncbi:MAG: winged helix-turn-helix domain-containing protein [Dehalococcoidia bacterium]
MEPRFKLWLEDGNGLAMSDYRARLLRYIRDSGSLAYAATAMGLSYRRAWGKVRELEQNLGFAVVHSDVGGLGGGKTRLTPAGVQLLDRYEAFQAAARAAIEAAYARCFPDEELSGEQGQEVQSIADDPVHPPIDQL